MGRKREYKNKYPLIPKNQWLSRKIPIEDIPIIKERHNAGESIKSIAMSYSVSYYCIWRYVISEEKNKEIKRRDSLISIKWVKQNAEKAAKNARRWKLRKFELSPVEFRKWRNEVCYKSNYAKSEKCRKYHREWHRKKMATDEEYRRKRIETARKHRQKMKNLKIVVK